MHKEVDLHVHSCYSDGSDIPFEILKKAREIGLRSISLTDHDTLAGVEDTIKTGKRFGIEVVPGVEISTEYKDYQIHILGYNFDLSNISLLEEHMRSQWEVNDKNALLAISRCALDKVLGINPEEVLLKIKKEMGRNNRPVFPVHIKDYIGQHPNIERELSYFSATSKEKDNRSAPRFLDPFRAIELINEWNGVAVLAHPATIIDRKGKTSAENLDIFLSLVNAFKRKNLFGIEVAHPSLGVKQRNLLQRLAATKELATTGGSDYHGRYRPRIELACEGISYKDLILR